jgi:photosystem II stability/assembly factor-like uncharacterized protein
VPLRGICTISPQEAWAIGEEGVLVHTTDSGRRWSRRILSPADSMAGVAFVDRSTGWAVGNQVFRTTDGGITWQPVDFVHASLGPVFFLDRVTGWTADRYSLYQSGDGGRTWQRWPRTNDRGPSGLFFFDALVGWLVTPWGDIERTTDGGRTWTVVHQEKDSLSRVWFADRQMGWAIGGNTVVHTSDGGSTWQRRAFPAAERVASASFVPSSIPGGAPVSYAAGIRGCVVKSTDGWLTHSVVRPLGAGPDLHDIRFSDADHGFAVGEYGVVIYTPDGGRTWSPRHSGGPGGFHRMDANDAAHAWLAADLGQVALTSDGGLRWNTVPVDGFSRFGTIKSVDFLADDLTGWAAGFEQGWGGTTSRISRSTDGGRTWQLQYTSTVDWFFETVNALDERTAVASGWMPRRGSRWLRTEDGGRTWQDVTPPTTVGVMYDSDFLDARVGYLAGGGIWKTVDAGRTWNELPPPAQAIEGISFADERHGWGVGGFDYIIRTTDGGASWQRQAAGRFASYRMLAVSAVSATEAWLVGDEYYAPWRRLVARTTDGGATWTEEDVTGDDVLFQAVAFVDAEHGWIAGGVLTGWQHFDGGIWKRSKGPPRVPSLSHDRLLAGAPAEFRVSGASVGDLAGILLTPTGIQGSSDLRLLPPILWLAGLTVQQDGSAAYSVELPASLPRIELHFQALVLRRSTGLLAATNTTSTWIEP